MSYVTRRNRIRDHIRLMLAEEKTVEEMARELRVSPLQIESEIAMYSISRTKPVVKHTPEHAVWCAKKWFELFDYPPSADDWSPFQVIKEGMPERADRFYRFREKFDAPYAKTVQKMFPSWADFIREAGLPPTTAGNKGRGRYMKRSLD